MATFALDAAAFLVHVSVSIISATTRSAFRAIAPLRKRPTLNKQFAASHAKRYGTVCEHCGTKRPAEELNYEAHIHHRSAIKCFDTKACERRKRKKK